MDLEEACRGRGVWVGRYRRSVLRLLAGEERHATVDRIHRAILPEHPRIRLATVYRTVKVLEEAGALVRLDFGDGLARYEAAGDTRHDHLIDRETGRVVEFRDERVEALLERIVQGLGYRLTGYRLNLYGSARPDTASGTAGPAPDMPGPSLQSLSQTPTYPPPLGGGGTAAAFPSKRVPPPPPGGGGLGWGQDLASVRLRGDDGLRRSQATAPLPP